MKTTPHLIGAIKTKIKQEVPTANVIQRFSMSQYILVECPNNEIFVICWDFLTSKFQVLPHKYGSDIYDRIENAIARIITAHKTKQLALSKKNGS